MRFKIIFFSILALHLFLTGCATSPERRADIPIPMPEEFDLYLCKSINTEAITTGKFAGKQLFVSAGEVTDEFIVGNGRNAYAIAHWFDLVPKAEYEFKFKWLLPDGRTAGVKKVKQKVLSSDWVIHNHLNLDLKYNLPSGIWTLHVYVNAKPAGAKKFIIARDEQELKTFRNRME